MSDFTVRVELHGATADDYNNLHDAMAKYGFYRAFVAFDGHTYELPTAEYAHTSVSDQFAVRDLVLQVARSLKAWAKDPWVVVTKADGERAVSTRRIR
jgi:hypothetical protein